MWNERNEQNFPCKVVLTMLPESGYARENMTVGQEYTAYGRAGSCLIVSTNVPDDKTIIWEGRFRVIEESK